MDVEIRGLSLTIILLMPWEYVAERAFRGCHALGRPGACQEVGSQLQIRGLPEDRRSQPQTGGLEYSWKLAMGTPRRLLICRIWRTVRRNAQRLG